MSINDQRGTVPSVQTGSLIVPTPDPTVRDVRKLRTYRPHSYKYN